jgi:hypothetical protein
VTTPEVPRRLTVMERGVLYRALLDWADQLDMFKAPPSVTRDAIRNHAKLARGPDMAFRLPPA